MESTINRASSTMVSIPLKPHHHYLEKASLFAPKRTQFEKIVSGLGNNGSVPRSSPDLTLSGSTQDSVRQRGKLESLFCYDKSIPEEVIEKPIGLSVAVKLIGDKPPCPDCRVKGVVLCSTCSGSGLYIDSILESQGIMVKVRCLGCGGTGNIMCTDCGGRGHL